MRRLWAMRRFVRLTPFEQETAAGRAAERYRRATLSVIADVGAKACGMGLMFLSVGLTIPYLGAERFGIWATVSSLTATLALLDFGMGNALINRVAAAAGDGDDGVLVRTASDGLAALAVLGVLVGLALTGAAAVVPWDKIVKLHDAAALVETRRAGMIFAVLFGCSIAANATRSIFIGLQRAYEANLATALGCGAAMLAVWLGARAHAGVPELLLLSSGTQLLSALALLALGMRRGLLVWPGRGTIWFESRHLVSVGSLFLLLQIGTMVGWGADSLMIAHIRGVEDVAQFNIVQRLFQVVALPLAMLCAPLWSAYADAKARGETGFLRRTLRLSMLTNLAVGSFGVLVVAAIAQPAIRIWTKGAVTVPETLVIAFALWTTVQGLGVALGVFLNGSGVIKPQIVAVVSFVAIGLPLKWWWLARDGLVAFVIASMSAYLITHATVYLLLLRADVKSRSDATKRSAPAAPFGRLRHLLFG